MRTTSALLPLIVAAMAGPAVAGIESEASAFTEGREVAAELFVDLNLDGMDEAILHFADSCGELGCDWVILSMRDGEGVEIGGGRSHSLDLMPTEPMGAVIEADGVWWAWAGAEVFPHFSHLERPDVREIPASLGDREALATHTEWGDADPECLHAWSIDVTGDGQREKIIVVGDLAYSIGGAASPYAIFGADGSVLATGYSMDFPRVFTNPAGGARVIEVMPRAIAEKQIGG